MRRVDGPAPSQASITLTMGLEPVPRIPKFGPAGSYPKGCAGSASASTVFRDDLLFVKANQQNLLTSAGVTMHGCKTSMGHEAIPEPGREDDWCAQWMFIGLAKNNETNPEDGNFSATGGDMRASSSMEAVQTAGSHSVKYTGTHPIHAGQLIVFHEPPINKDYSRRDSRPLMTLGPLDWTRMLANPLHAIDITMLDMQQNGVGTYTLDVDYLLDADVGGGGGGGGSGVDPTWEHAALQRKRSILTEGATLLSVLAKRGYIKILDLATSWKEACTEKYIARMKELSQDKATTADAFREAYEEYQRDLADGYENELINNSRQYSEEERTTWCYDSTEKRIKPLDLNQFPNWLQQFIVPRETLRGLVFDDVAQDFQRVENGIAWLIRALGLGEASAEQEHTRTVLEILRLCCRASLDPLDTEDLLSTTSDLFSGKASNPEVEESMSAFRRHLENHEMGLATTIFKMQDRVNRRVVGLSMSSVPGVNQEMPGGTEPILDFILGVRTI